MITALGLAALPALVTILIGTSSLPVANWIVINWALFYTSFVPPELAERRNGEVLSDVHEQISAYSAQGYRPVEIAPKLIYRWIMGFTTDVTWCLPYAPAVLANKAAVLSQSLWALRKIKIAVPAVGVISLMNYAYLSSSGERTWTFWLMINATSIAMVVLLSQQHHLWVRRILFSILGIGGIGSIGYMAWYIGPTKLFALVHLPDFRGLLLGMTALCLILLTGDKAVRTRVFKGRWSYVITCWVFTIVASLIASWLLAGSVTSVLSAWAAFFALLAALFVFAGIATLIGFGIWYGALKGGSAGLQAVANGLRRVE